MTPHELLGPALLEAIRQVVREELLASQESESGPVDLLTPGEASGVLGGRPSAETIVGWVKRGRLPTRTNNVEPNPKRPNYLVSLEEIRGVLAGQERAVEVPEA